MASPSEKWNRRYALSVDDYPKPAATLAEQAFLLPRSGTALDLACGLGGNALFLARAGLTVHAWDISALALAKLRQFAATTGLAIHTRCLDIQPQDLTSANFDVIAVSGFLDRALCDAIVQALKPGGLLFYQTRTREKTSAQGPHNPAYLLAVNELLQLFSTLRIVFYREHGIIGDFSQGLRNKAQLIGQKPLVKKPA